MAHPEALETEQGFYHLAREEILERQAFKTSGERDATCALHLVHVRLAPEHFVPSAKRDAPAQVLKHVVGVDHPFFAVNVRDKIADMFAVVRKGPK